MNSASRPNSWVSQADAATTKLTYAMQLDPAPLTVSIAGRDPILASLEFVITNPTSTPIQLTSITFTLQVGATADCITSSVATAGAITSDPTNWQVQIPSSVSSGPADFVLLPATGSGTLPAQSSLVVEIFSLPTMENAGNSTISVKETISSGPTGFTSFLVSTFPTGFYFNGLSAAIESGSTLVPVAQVAMGSPITLVWNSSVVDVNSFTIYYSTGANGQQKATPSDTGIWTSPPLVSDTVFTIVVTVSVQGGAPLSAALSTSVAVQNPTLIAASITTGAATVNGALAVTGATEANAVTATGLTVNGAASVGNLTASGTLSVPGQSTLGSVGVSGNLNVAGNTSLSGLNVSGSANTGPLQAASLSASSASLRSVTVAGINGRGGQVAMISGVQSITPGSWQQPKGYTAPTDGFAIGVIGFPSSGTDGCMCYGYGQTAGMTVFATGGNVGFFGPAWSDCMASNPNSFVLPVPAGYAFYIAVQQGSTGQQSNAPYWYYWMPIGSGNVGAAVHSMEGLSADFVPPAPLTSTERRHPLEGLVAVLEELTGKRVDATMRKKLGL